MSALQGPHDAPPPNDPGDECQQRVLDRFHSFPFSSDEAFQEGLSGILAHSLMHQMTDNERSELVLKTKVFYFNRRHLIKVRASVTGHNLSLEDVQDGYTADLNRFPVPQSGNEFSQTCSGAEREEMRVLTFAELKSLIEQGKTDDIPNNKLIPNVLNDGAPSESTAQLRRKPWERTSQS
ncbi:hypothetical protein V8E55_003144 [Tylopilus felleus]